MARKTAGAPAIVLIVSGVLGLLYALGYFLWTLWPLLWGVIAIVSTIAEKGLTSDAISATLLFFSMPAIQTLLFLVTIVTASITLFAGIRFNQWRSPGLVWLGILCSTGTPVIGAIANSASMFNCGTLGVGIFGCIVGNAGTIPIFVIGLVASIWGAVVMFSDKSENFAAV